MKAYKGFYKDESGKIFCQPNDDVKFYYEEGKTYETDKAELCECGFHACTMPMDVFEYYSSKYDEVEFHEVELEGVTDYRDNDSKVCGTKITIGRKITPDEMLELSIQMIMADKDRYFSERNLNFYNGKILKIVKDTKCNFINLYGEFISELWFDWTEGFYGEFSRIYMEDKGYNFINTEGKLLLSQYVHNADCFYKGLATVYDSNNKQCYINTDGNFISDQWFDFVERFFDRFALVRIGNKWNYLKTDGSYLSPSLWFDNAWHFSSLYGKVELDGKYNYIDFEGKLVRDQWFDNPCDADYIIGIATNMNS